MYEAHFGLKARPFRLTPEVAFFYPSEQHRRALAFLEYGLHEGEGFIVISGEPGTGKTTLVSKLLDEHAGDRMRVATIETTRLEGSDLLELTLRRFDMPVAGKPSKAELLERLRAGLARWAQMGARALLIVDEAQNLPADTIEELRMLSNLVRDERPLLQIFLVGQPALRDLIESPAFVQLRQRVTAAFHLQPFRTPDEVRAYVEHRLTQAGWTGRPTFDADCFEEIHARTRGTPRLINALCDRLLLHAFIEDHDEIGHHAVESVTEEMGLLLSIGVDDAASRGFDLAEPSRAAAERDARSSDVLDDNQHGLLRVVGDLIDRIRKLEYRVVLSERRVRQDLARLSERRESNERNRG